MSDLAGRAWQTVKQARFLTHDPEQLWAMVEAADGATASDLRDLLTQAAKTIKEIGTDLQTHSLAVEWEGEGGEAFRTWINQAALATLSLGDYSETAGKWLGHAADTLHEVKPQLEILRKQSATARSVLDVHAAKATDVGNHDGGPSDVAVKTAKTSYANDSAEAGGQMMKLAQSYAASTEQIDALAAPEFPKLPEQFVPTNFHDTKPVDVSTTGRSAIGGAAARATGAGHEAAVGTAPSGTSSASHVTTSHRLVGVPDTPDATPGRLADPTNTAIDSVGTVPSAPTVPPTPSVPPSGSSSPHIQTPSPTGLLPPAFGGGGTFPAGPRVRGGIPSYGGRSSVPPVPSGPNTSGSTRAPIAGRGLPGAVGPGTPGNQPASGRGPAGAAPSRGTNGVTGGRPVSPTAGRPAGAIPRGNVIGGTPSEQQTPVGRRGVTGGTGSGAGQTRGGSRMANRESGAPNTVLSARSDGIAGGQPRPSQGRGRTPLAPGNARVTRGMNANGTQLQRGATAQGASASSASSTNRGERAARDERSGRSPDQREETEEEYSRPSPPRLPAGPDGHAQREG
ncbi:hypothetical protein [Streptomyces mirabilis]|uniref:hypothetical protein n=1 Tax=Streptomyces mirabilis TaxID=68239 RepID=UPI0036EBE580